MESQEYDQIKERMPPRCEEAWSLRYTEPGTALQKLEEEETGSGGADEVALGTIRLLRAFVRFLHYREKEHFQEVHQLARSFHQQERPREAAIAHDLLARIADAYGEYGQGMDEVLKGLEEVERVDDPELKGELLASKGNLLNRTGAHDAAIRELEEALSIRKEQGDEKAIASALNLLGRSYTMNGEPEKGLVYYEEVRELRERIGDEGGLPWTFLGMGTAYEKAQRYGEALQHFDRALTMDGGDHPVLQLLVRTGKARCLEAMEQTEEAVREAEEALERAEELDSDPLRCEALEALYRVEKKAGVSEKALEYLERYQEYRERVLRASEKDRIRCQEEAFQAEKKEKEAEIQRLRNVELKEAYEVLDLRNKEIRDSLNYASRIQQGLLPEEQELERLFPEHFILFRPLELVSGDFYWAGDAGEGEEERRFFVAADCTGHGVPGAFMSLLAISFLNELIHDKGLRSPAAILDQLRDRVIRTLNPTNSVERETRADGMDLTLIAYLPKKGVLEFSGANNPLYLIRRKEASIPEDVDRSMEGEDRELHEFRTDRQPVGISERSEPFTERRLTVEPEDRVFLLSDGMPDQFGGEKGKKFKYRRLKSNLLELSDRTMKEQRRILEERFYEWCNGYEQVDDVILAGIGFKGG